MTIATLLKPLEDRSQKSQGADAQQRSLAAKSFSLPTALPPTFSQPPMFIVAQDSSINTLLADKSNRVYTLTELNNSPIDSRNWLKKICRLVVLIQLFLPMLLLTS